MKIFRHIAGIVLGAFGLVIMLGAGVLIFDAVHRVSLGIAVLIFVLLGLLPFAGAFTLLRSTLTTPGNPCPQCGGTEHVTAGVLRPARNWWLFYIFGWLFAALWRASRKQQVRCVQCDTRYLTATAGTRIAGTLLWMFLLMIALIVIIQQLVEAEPSLAP